MKNCNVRQLREVLRNEANCLLIDVREYTEFAAGRIPGARLIPMGELSRYAVELDATKSVYLVCQTGRRSGEAQQQLKALGFTDVRNVTGGMTEWIAAGFEIQREENAPWSLERQVRLVAGMIVLIGVILSIIVAQEFVWLAGFIGAGLTFAALTDNCTMGLLLAQLPWNRPSKTQVCALEPTDAKE